MVIIHRCGRTASILAIGAVVAALVMMLSPRPAREATQRFVYERAEMGVPFRISLYAEEEAVAQRAAEAAFDRVAVLNSIFSDYDSDTELSRLSQTSGQGKQVPVSSDLWRILEKSQTLAAQTDGAFDITVGPIVNLWRRSRRKHEFPPEKLLTEMRNRVGYKNLSLDAAKKTAELRIPDMRLDLGAIAKGYAADEALKVLRARGVPRALVAASGDMAVGDPPPEAEGWRIEVAALDVPGAPPPEIVLLKNCGIATSGDVFQHVEINGVRYSHIVDPRTGVGLTDHSLVTIIAPDCTTADGIATAVSVLGPQKGMAFVESQPGVAAHIVRKPGPQIEVKVSRGWKRSQK
jgi:thiamine biosynthesis lipoprotein